MRKTGHVLESLPVGFSNSLVGRRLPFPLGSKQGQLWRRRVERASPRLVPPESGKPLCLLGVYRVGVLAEGISIDVHGWEVDEELGRPQASQRLNGLPVELEAVRVEDAERSAIIPVQESWSNLVNEHSVAVAMVDDHIFPTVGDSLESGDLQFVEVDQMVLAERRFQTEGDLGTARHRFAALTGDVPTGTGEGIDVDVVEPGRGLGR